MGDINIDNSTVQNVIVGNGNHIYVDKPLGEQKRKSLIGELLKFHEKDEIFKKALQQYSRAAYKDDFYHNLKDDQLLDVMNFKAVLEPLCSQSAVRKNLISEIDNLKKHPIKHMIKRIFK